MPRLDVWLVEENKFSSRQAAKRAIKAGYVTVDGKSAKPSTQVKKTQVVVISSDASDLPIGYDKLRQLDEIIGFDIVNPGNLVLDIGSSAGGFLCYLAEKKASAIGIEISKEFEEKLKSIVNKHENLSLIIGDAFFIDPIDICPVNELDLLLIDVTTDVSGTISLIERFSTLLKENGKLIVAFKIKEIKPDLVNRIASLGYAKIETITLDISRKELHLIAFRR
jgi:23S rRNA (cytidine1920-2'-O)/16S rRNA (cytidine1409-2'-O)-methyltransferase